MNVSGGLAKHTNDKFLASGGKRDDTNAPVFGACHTADEPFAIKTIHGEDAEIIFMQSQSYNWRYPICTEKLSLPTRLRCC